MNCVLAVTNRLYSTRLRAAVLWCLLLAPVVSIAAGELHDAVRAADNATIETLLVGGVDVNESDFVFGTALHVAVSEGSTEIVKVLLDHGADVEAVSEQQGSRSMHLAAEFGYASVLGLLLDHGADIEAQDQNQRTPLLRATTAGHLSVVRLLLDRGANVHTKEGLYGQTPIHWAAYRGHLGIVQLLIEHGADIHARDNTGLTPFRMAIHPQSYSVVGGPKLLEYLVAEGADPNVKDTSGLSVLGYAEEGARGDPVYYKEIVKELRRLGATE